MEFEEFKYLLKKENWTNADYQKSLEVLRDDQSSADGIYQELDDNIFYDILDFEAGRLENFLALTAEQKEAYKEVFIGWFWED